MPDLSHIAAIAFDLDGTLVDSAPDISHALNTALGSAGLRSFDLCTARAWIGDGPDVLIARALSEQGIATASAELKSRLRRDFDVATLAAPLKYGTVYGGIAELIAGLRHVLPMVVITNKPTALARAVLEAAQLLRFMAGVHGADTAALRKPDPAMLLAAAARWGLPASCVLMVGDGPADVQAADAAGCPCALVAWGYGSDSVPAHLNPWRVETPKQLLHSLITQTPCRQRTFNDRGAHDAHRR